MGERQWIHGEQSVQALLYRGNRVRNTDLHQQRGEEPLVRNRFERRSGIGGATGYFRFSMLYRMPGERSVQNDGAQYHRRRYRVHSPQDQGRPWCNGACAAFQSRAGDSRPLSRAVARWFVPVLHRAEIQCENQGGVQACRTCPHGDDHRPANAAGGATAVIRGGIIPHGPAHVYREYLQEGERPELGRISERPQGGQQGVCPLPRYRRGDEKGVSWVIGVIDNTTEISMFETYGVQPIL